MLYNKNIKVYPTHIEILQYNLGDIPMLEKVLSVWDKVYHTCVFEAFYYDPIKRILSIPGGFDISYLEKLTNSVIDVSNKNVVCTGRDNKFSLKFPTRNTLQNQAINFLLKDHSQKFLSLETGGGKTYCAIHYVFKKKEIPITFVDQESIMQQWKDRILYFTNIEEDEIFLISGIKSIEKLLDMNKKEISKYKWFIAVHRTLNNYLENNDSDKVKELFSHIGIGIRLYDEAHVEYKNIFNMDRCYDCKSVYITATPKRSNFLEDKVYQNMFNEKYIPRFIGQGELYHNVIVYKYNTHPSIDIEGCMQGKYGFDTTKWTNYIMEEDNKVLFEEELENVFKSVFKTNKHKVAVLLKSIDMCDSIAEYFKEYFKEQDLTVGVYHSKIKKKEEQLEKDIIFTTEKSFGKAIDIKGLSICINTVPCSSETSVLQIIGRLRYIEDKEVFFIDMYDEGFNAQVKQASRRLVIYRKKAKLIYKLQNKK